MTKAEFNGLVKKIEDLWPGLEWVNETQIKTVYVKFEAIDLAAASEAVDLAFSGGYDYPPRPARLAMTALTVQRRTRLSLPRESEDGLYAPAQTAEEYAMAHDGYSPSQVAMRAAGRDPGPPRYGEES